jgi:hypothetical protein
VDPLLTPPRRVGRAGEDLAWFRRIPKPNLPDGKECSNGCLKAWGGVVKRGSSGGLFITRGKSSVVYGQTTGTCISPSRWLGYGVFPRRKPVRCWRGHSRKQRIRPVNEPQLMRVSCITLHSCISVVDPNVHVVVTVAQVQKIQVTMETLD